MIYGEKRNSSPAKILTNWSTQSWISRFTSLWGALLEKGKWRTGDVKQGDEGRPTYKRGWRAGGMTRRNPRMKKTYSTN